VSNSELVNVVRSVLCRSLTAEQATELADATVPLAVLAGGTVFSEGEKSTGLLIFLRGSVEISRQTPNGRSHALATVAAPSVIGEMSLITDRPRSATVRAVSACEFYLLTKAQFRRLIAAERIAAYKLVGTIAEVLAGRLDGADQKLLALGDTDREAAPVEELTVLREKLFSEWSF
jgi:CRP/FNR family cyclic AMP-dependent transcriptional regulator